MTKDPTTSQPAVAGGYAPVNGLDLYYETFGGAATPLAQPTGKGRPA